VPAIRRLRLLSPTQALTTMKRYQIVAARAHRELFPSSLHDEQVYWTAVGVPAAQRKSVFDEYGDLEAFKGAPLVQPLWRDRSGRAAAAYQASATDSLRNGWMPMPAVQWSPQPGLQLRSEAIAADQAPGPVTFVRHRLVNTGASRVDGQLAIVVRPMQVNPPWQHGGLSPIRTVQIAGTGARPIVSVNGRALLTSLTPATARGAVACTARRRSRATWRRAACRSGSAPGMTRDSRPPRSSTTCTWAPARKPTWSSPSLWVMRRIPWMRLSLGQPSMP